MARMLIAFWLALFFHILLGVLPWSQEKHILPEPTGNDAISIKLFPFNSAKKEIVPRQTKQYERSQSRSLPRGQETKSKPTESLPETNSPKDPVAKPVPHIQKNPVTKVVQQAAPLLSHNPITSTPASALPATPVNTLSTTPEKSDISPAIVKAKPLYHQNPKPPYPNLARKRGWQGVVILAVMVLEDGSPGQVEIETSSSHELLDKTALKAVKQWHFLPGTKNDIPAVMEVLVPVHFVLQ